MTTLRLKPPEPTEAQVMQAVRTALRFHKACLGIWRVNSGAHVVGQGTSRRFVRYHDIDGCSDLIGILKGGRWLAVECKRPSKRNAATDKQQGFLERIRKAGGVAFVATSADEARRQLDEALDIAERFAT